MFKTFVDQCLSGAAAPDEIDAFVARWHNDRSAAMPLNEYLGLSQGEYRQWAEKPQTLAEILSARKSKKRLAPA